MENQRRERIGTIRIQKKKDKDLEDELRIRKRAKSLPLSDRKNLLGDNIIISLLMTE